MLWLYYGTCALCSLPPLSDSFLSEDSVRFEEIEVSVGMHDQAGEGINANQDFISPQELEAKRTNSSKDLLLCHLNINSIQNKFDELAYVIHKLKAHIILSEKRRMTQLNRTVSSIYQVTHCFTVIERRVEEVFWLLYLL